VTTSDRPAPTPGQSSHPGKSNTDKDGSVGKNVNWEAYEVPGIWQMVQGEGNREAEDLVMAFYKISQSVDDTRLRIIDAGKRLALGWSGSAAADLAQAQITEVADSMQKDTAAYVTATGELSNVIDRLAEAKTRIKPLYDQWTLLSQLPQESGIFTSVLVQSDVYQQEVQQTNAAARDEMRRLDRDLSGARITTTDEYVPSTGMPTTNDLQLAGLAPQAIAAATMGRGGGLGGGGGLLAGGLPEPASVVPGAGGLGGLVGADPGSGGRSPGRTGVPGVIGGDTSGTRPMAGGAMGGAMGAGGHGGAAAGGGGKANTRWSARSGVDPVIDSAPPPDPSTMGVDDSFDKQQKRK